MSRQQTAARYRLRTRVIAWSILVVTLGGGALIAWSEIAAGDYVRPALVLAVTALIAGASYRNARLARTR